MTYHLSNIKAIVTGGAAGIGREIVLALLRQGASVLAADINAQALDTLQTESFGPGQLQCCTVNLTDEDGPDRVLAQALTAFGSVNVLICNAGIGRAAYTTDFKTAGPRVWEIDDVHWQRFLAVNALAPIRLTRKVVPHLLSNGWGRVIAITTSLETMVRAGSGPYGPSKAALESFTAVLSRELKGTGVTANVVIPGGAVDTGMVPDVSGMARQNLMRPDVLVPPVLWLMTQDANDFGERRIKASLWDPQATPSHAAEVASDSIAWAQPTPLFG